MRIVAATNRDPEREVMKGQMRQDLYYRLASMVIRVPPLRERVEDVGPLARSLLNRVHAQTGRGPRSINDEAIAVLEAHPWPGNVRELRNVIERVSIVVDRDVLTPEGLEMSGVRLSQAHRAEPASPVDDAAPFEPRSLEDVAREAAEEAERRHIEATLAHTEGNKSRAAELLGVSRSTLWKKLRRFDP